MKKRIYPFKTTWVVVCMIFFSGASQLKGQVFWDSAVATNVQTCLQPEDAVVKFTALATQAANTSLRITAPAGITINQIVSVTLNGSSFSTAPTVAFSSSNRVVLVTFNSGLALGDVVRIQFRHFATCAAGVSSYTVQDSFLYTGSSGTSSQLGQLFNGSSPALSITNISNTPGTASVGSSVIRKFTVTNGGNGSSSHFFVSDNFGAGNLSINTSSFVINPSGVNYSVPGAKITLVADSVSVSFDVAQIQQIGDGDTLFENGESFELQYTVVPQVCGAGNVLLSQYRTSWLCPGNSRCNYYSVSDGLSISVPGAPNVVYFQSLPRNADCWNNNLWIDTGSVKNIGTGPAKDVIIRVGINGYPVVFRGDMTGYFDTSKFYVRLGKNGAWIKVPYTVFLTGSNALSYIGCNQSGKPMVVQFTWPSLNAGDTLYFTAPIEYCNFNFGCDASQDYLHQPGYLARLQK